jgi:hypothetical protein
VGFESTLIEACEFVRNNMNNIPLTVKEKSAIQRRRMCDHENGNEPIANPENRFRIEYFNMW